MPDLIRHPEYNEITGFRFPGQPKDRLCQNDNLRKFQTLYETSKILKSTEFIYSTLFIRHSSFPMVVPFVLQIDAIVLRWAILRVPVSVFRVERGHGAAVIYK